MSRGIVGEIWELNDRAASGWSRRLTTLTTHAAEIPHYLIVKVARDRSEARLLFISFWSFHFVSESMPPYLNLAVGRFNVNGYLHVWCAVYGHRHSHCINRTRTARKAVGLRWAVIWRSSLVCSDTSCQQGGWYFWEGSALNTVLPLQTSQHAVAPAARQTWLNAPSVALINSADDWSPNAQLLFSTLSSNNACTELYVCVSIF